MRPHSLILAAVASVSVALAGCAGTPDRPESELSRARTMVDQAAQSGAQQFAASDLNRAREKLRLADKAADAGREREARDLAEQAAVDAELAQAKARRMKTEQSAEELDRSVEALQRETRPRPSNLPSDGQIDRQ